MSVIQARKIVIILFVCSPSTDVVQTSKENSCSSVSYEVLDIQCSLCPVALLIVILLCKSDRVSSITSIPVPLPNAKDSTDLREKAD